MDTTTLSERFPETQVWNAVGALSALAMAVVTSLAGSLYWARATGWTSGVPDPVRWTPLALAALATSFLVLLSLVMAIRASVPGAVNDGIGPGVAAYVGLGLVTWAASAIWGDGAARSLPTTVLFWPMFVLDGFHQAVLGVGSG